MPESQSHKHKHYVGPDTCPNARARGPSSPAGRWRAPPGAVLTAVRPGTAEHGVGQQASRGATRGTVHEAVLTVAAERKVRARLCKSGDPDRPLFLASCSPSVPSNLGRLITHRKHSLPRLPMASVLRNLMACLLFFPYLIPFNTIHHCDYSILGKEKTLSWFTPTFPVAPAGSPPCWLHPQLSLLTLRCPPRSQLL